MFSTDVVRDFVDAIEKTLKETISPATYNAWEIGKGSVEQRIARVTRFCETYQESPQTPSEEKLLERIVNLQNRIVADEKTINTLIDETTRLNVQVDRAITTIDKYGVDSNEFLTEYEQDISDLKNEIADIKNNNEIREKQLRDLLNDKVNEITEELETRFLQQPSNCQKKRARAERARNVVDEESKLWTPTPEKPACCETQAPMSYDEPFDAVASLARNNVVVKIDGFLRQLAELRPAVVEKAPFVFCLGLRGTVEIPMFKTGNHSVAFAFHFTDSGDATTTYGFTISEADPRWVDVVARMGDTYVGFSIYVGVPLQKITGTRIGRVPVLIGEITTKEQFQPQIYSSEYGDWCFKCTGYNDDYVFGVLETPTAIRKNDISIKGIGTPFEKIGIVIVQNFTSAGGEFDLPKPVYADGYSLTRGGNNNLWILKLRRKKEDDQEKET